MFLLLNEFFWIILYKHYFIYIIFTVSWSSQNFAPSWLINNYAIFTRTVTQSPETICGDSFGLCSLLDFPDPSVLRVPFIVFFVFFSWRPCLSCRSVGVHFTPYSHSKLIVLPLLKWTLYPNVKTASGVVLSFLARVSWTSALSPAAFREGAHQSQLSPRKEGTGHRLPSTDVHLSFHDHGRSSSTKEKRSPKHVMVLLDDLKICQGFW